MNASLGYFIHTYFLRPLNRILLTDLLRELKHCLPPDAAALLGVRLDHEEYCAAWAAQFRCPAALGAPLREALVAIETLARPENRPLLKQALCHLPPGFEVNQSFPPLNQALHLWLIVRHNPGVTWPLPSTPAQSESENPRPAAGGTCAVETPENRPLLPPLPLGAGQREANLPQNDPCDSSSPTTSQNSTIETQNPNIEPAPRGSNSDQSKVEKQNSKIITASPDTTPDEANSSAPPPTAPSDHSKIETDEQAFIRLARLAATDYDRVRRGEAKRLHLRLATLDDAVGRARILEDDAQANAVILPQLRPWPEPILDAPVLFDQVHDRFLLYLYLPAGAPVVFTLWTPHAHAVSAFSQTPRLNLTSTEPGCGKSTALELLATMTPNVLRTDSLKPAVLFRVVHLYHPTLLLDELDAYLHLYPELRGLLNAGNNPAACVYRCEGRVVRSFKAFAATALAGIGHLSHTLRDRSIVVPLVKAPPGALQARFDKRHVDVETTLGRKIARWTQDNFPAIAACDPVLPPAAYNRLADNWRPLFALAQVIGGHWPQRVLDAFHAFHPSSSAGPSHHHSTTPALQPSQSSTPRATNSQPSTIHSQLLLSDLRQLFTQSDADRLFSRDLVESLRALPDRPWSGANNGDEPLNEHRLARHLSPFGIRPALLRIGQRRGKGYKLADFPPPPQ